MKLADQQKCDHYHPDYHTDDLSTLTLTRTDNENITNHLRCNGKFCLSANYYNDVRDECIIEKKETKTSRFQIPVIQISAPYTR